MADAPPELVTVSPAISSFADRIKIARSGRSPDINLAIQFILNCGVESAGSCNGGDHYEAYLVN